MTKDTSFRAGPVPTAVLPNDAGRSTRRITQETREQTLRFLAFGLTHREVALRTGISQRSVLNILSEPGARKDVERLRRELGRPDAIDVLVGIMNSTHERSADRIAAAKALLSQNFTPDEEAEGGPPQVTVIGSLPDE